MKEYQPIRGRGRVCFIPALFRFGWVGCLVLGCAGSPYTAYNRGIELLRQGNTEQAEVVLHQAVREEPDNAAAWNQLGIIAFERREWDAAEQRFRKAYDLNRLDPAYPRNLAYVYAQKKQYDTAEPLLLRSLELNPSDPKTLTALAKIALLQGHPDRAKELLQKALQIDPAYPEAVELLRRVGEEGG